MKNTTRLRKLAVHRETLRALTGIEFAGVKGGVEAATLAESSDRGTCAVPAAVLAAPVPG